MADSHRPVYSRLVALWQSDPKGMALDLLRVGIGFVWAMNLLFILAPSNDYFAGFQNVASGFNSTTLGGPTFADFVAAHSTFFAWAIALLTGYLAVAFLAGFTTRFACFVGEVASVIFLLTQFTSTFTFAGGGTDVGPHPLYILVYVILVAGGAGQYVAVDHWIWSTGRARFPRLSRWVASPNIGRPTPGGSVSGGVVPDGGAVARPARAKGLSDQTFYNVTAGVAILVVMASFTAAYVGGSSAPPAPTAGAPPPTSYAYLTITVNPNNGMPQFSPANFTVSPGTVEFTIIDQDSEAAWPGCVCNVTGTVGGVEQINDTAVSEVSSANAAHTFTITSLGLNVISPGNGTITFSVTLSTAGAYTWTCLAPCGGSGYTGAPMGVAGYMTGTMWVS